MEPNQIEIRDGFSSEYDVYNDLGRGKFAIVKRVRKRGDDETYRAAKIIDKNMIDNQTGFTRHAEKEAEILSCLNHSKIISLFDVYESKNELVLVLELIGHGELFDYVSERDYLSEEDAALFIFQILQALDYIHKHRIVHLDLKPENIMVEDKDQKWVKLIDFGIAKNLDKENDNTEVKEVFGTPEFVSPELIAQLPLTPATDMWSMGVVTYILLSGASPFLGENNLETFDNIRNIDYRFDEELFPNTSELAKDFMRKLFVEDVRLRYSANKCLSHPWIQPCSAMETEERSKSTINMNNFRVFVRRNRWEREIVREGSEVSRDQKGNRHELKERFREREGGSASETEEWDGVQTKRERFRRSTNLSRHESFKVDNLFGALI
ncbi:hypothetical protein ACOME3_006701 [Neoechinorhynchus agilis]